MFAEFTIVGRILDVIITIGSKQANAIKHYMCTNRQIPQQEVDYHVDNKLDVIIEDLLTDDNQIILSEFGKVYYVDWLKHGFNTDVDPEIIKGLIESMLTPVKN